MGTESTLEIIFIKYTSDNVQYNTDIIKQKKKLSETFRESMAWLNCFSLKLTVQIQLYFKN
jgi:hypothetical protein